jgi:putative membrane protein
MFPPKNRGDLLVSDEVQTKRHDPLFEKRRENSKKVTDHLANERTFLAWIRTVLAMLTFGAMVSRLGNRLGTGRLQQQSLLSPSFLAGCFTMFSVILLALAFYQFLNLRSTIEREHFRPQALLALLLAVGVGFVALVLTLSLFLF